MCLSVRRFDRKNRNLIAAGCLLLAVGNSLRIIVHPHSGAGLNALDFVSGLLLGTSIGLNLFAMIRARKVLHGRG